jgi:hypothetical protein
MTSWRLLLAAVALLAALFSAVHQSPRFLQLLCDSPLSSLLLLLGGGICSAGDGSDANTKAYRRPLPRHRAPQAIYRLRGAGNPLFAPEAPPLGDVGREVKFIDSFPLAQEPRRAVWDLADPDFATKIARDDATEPLLFSAGDAPTPTLRWRAFDRWDLDYFAANMPAVLPRTQRYPTPKMFYYHANRALSGAMPFPNTFGHARYHQTVLDMPRDPFVALLRQESPPEFAYLSAGINDMSDVFQSDVYPLDPFTVKNESYFLPEFRGQEHVFRWTSAGVGRGTVTPVHNDISHNFFTMVHGSKVSLFCG